MGDWVMPSEQALKSGAMCPQCSGPWSLSYLLSFLGFASGRDYINSRARRQLFRKDELYRHDEEHHPENALKSQGRERGREPAPEIAAYEKPGAKERGGLYVNVTLAPVGPGREYANGRHHHGKGRALGLVL